MASKTIEDKELGEIKLTKYKHGKNLRIKIDEAGKIAISLPHYIRYEDGLRFLNEKRLWVKSQLNRHCEERQRRSNPEQGYKTKFRELELIPCDVAKATYRLSPTKIKVYYPSVIASPPARNDDAMQDPEVQELIKTAIEAALRREAHDYLPHRLKELASIHGLKYNRVSIRKTKTRWGSCTHDNNINLCIHLMKLPDSLIDYVLLHELAHTVEKNHSSRFWDLLSAMLGANAKAIDKELKAHRPNI